MKNNNRLSHLFLLAAGLLAATPLTAQTSYTLEQCRNLALEHHVKMRNGALDVQIAAQTSKEAFTHYFPQIAATGALFRTSTPMLQADIALPPLPALAALGIPGNFPFEMLDRGTMAGVTALQPIFAGGQIVNSNKLARIGRDVSTLQLQLTENEVAATTEKYFWQLVALKEKLQTIGVVEAQLNELHTSVCTAVEAGISTRNDLLRVELQQQRLTSDRLRVENGIRVTKLLLRHQTGIEERDFEIAFDDFGQLASPLDYYLSPEEGLDRRAESQLLDAQVDAARYRKRLALGRNLPSVGVGAGYFYHDLTSKDTDFGMVFASVSVPISGWWGGSHDMKRERLRQQQAENDREDARAMMLVEIESKWNDLQEAYSQIEVAARSIASAEENLRLNNDYYEAGTVSLTDLLDAQTLLQQSRDQRTDACTTYCEKVTAYLQATGR